MLNKITCLFLVLMLSLLLPKLTTAQTTTDINLKFAKIPAGQFIMGTENIDDALNDLPDPKAAMINDETPAHTVTFKKPFYLSRTEVTQGAWLKIMHTKPGPESHWQAKNWASLPVVSVSWTAANQFINELNKASTDKRYRLPTETEWEYAARAGSDKLRPFPKIAMDEYAWYLLSSNDEIQAVALLNANDFGLYDMYGNAWEWVSDWYSPTAYADATGTDTGGPKKGTKKVRRGGSYHCPPHLIRPAYRAADTPDKAYSVLGFRLVMENK